jgi:hypothetical protein
MEVLNKCGIRNIILTSGTLSPLDSFAYELQTYVAHCTRCLVLRTRWLNRMHQTIFDSLGKSPRHRPITSVGWCCYQRPIGPSIELGVSASKQCAVSAGARQCHCQLCTHSTQGPVGLLSIVLDHGRLHHCMEELRHIGVSVGTNRSLQAAGCRTARIVATQRCHGGLLSESPRSCVLGCDLLCRMPWKGQ